MNLPLVDIRTLSVTYRSVGRPDVSALRNLTLSIPRGEWTALVGESGSGKSALALAIGGLAYGAEIKGSIRWNGAQGPLDLDRINEENFRILRGRRIAYIFQDPSSAFSPVERIGTQLMRMRGAHWDESGEMLKQKTLDMLHEVSLSDPKRVFLAYPHELSGGMRQRVAIAAALISEPELLIADEPTTALDPVIEAEILNLIMTLKTKHSLTILFITHDLSLAARLADRVHVLRRGERMETAVRVNGEIRLATSYGKALFLAGRYPTQPKAYLEVPRVV